MVSSPERESSLILLAGLVSRVGADPVARDLGVDRSVLEDYLLGRGRLPREQADRIARVSVMLDGPTVDEQLVDADDLAVGRSLRRAVALTASIRGLGSVYSSMLDAQGRHILDLQLEAARLSDPSLLVPDATPSVRSVDRAVSELDSASCLNVRTTLLAEIAQLQSAFRFLSERGYGDILESLAASGGGSETVSPVPQRVVAPPFPTPRFAFLSWLLRVVRLR